QAGAAIHLQHPVVGVEPSPGGEVSLTVQSPGGASTRVTARHVIMAIPSDPLARIVERSPFLQDAKLTAAMATVGTSPASKMFLAFDKPWWSALGIAGGHPSSDLATNHSWDVGDGCAQRRSSPRARAARCALGRPRGVSAPAGGLPSPVGGGLGTEAGCRSAAT